MTCFVPLLSRCEDHGLDSTAEKGEDNKREHRWVLISIQNNSAENLTLVDKSESMRNRFNEIFSSILL